MEQVEKGGLPPIAAVTVTAPASSVAPWLKTASRKVTRMEENCDTLSTYLASCRRLLTVARRVCRQVSRSSQVTLGFDIVITQDCL